MTDDAPSAPADGGDSPTVESRARDLHRRLEATAELPLDRTANRWLGEAEAVAADVATSDLDRETVLERVGKIQRLLSEVDETGHGDADDHLEAAESICAKILEADEDE